MSVQQLVYDLSVMKLLQQLSNEELCDCVLFRLNDDELAMEGAWSLRAALTPFIEEMFTRLDPKWMERE